MRFGVLGLSCQPCGQEACMWKDENSDFEDSCVKTIRAGETPLRNLRNCLKIHVVTTQLS